ncbi:MAG TPA: hypothetical protein VK921_14955 [Anditalea sp.]|nr:hypothetical protein [Anditalea sp.]
MFIPFIYIGILVLIHFFAYLLESLPLSKGKWLSFGGGISVSFVFIHLLPDLHEKQNRLAEVNIIPTPFEDKFIYILILAGVLSFYALEKGILWYKEKQESESKAISDGIYYWHLSVFSLYNILFGYLFFQEEYMHSLLNPLIFLAIAFHFITNDYALQHHHEKDYLYSGRWVMAGSVFMGGVIGYFSKMPEEILASIFAFLGGGIIINILKEEMHEEKENHLGSFLIGALLFSVVLML